MKRPDKSNGATRRTPVSREVISDDVISGDVVSDDVIRLRGVRQNNLRDIDLDIPLGLMTVVTGVSGSGKSSLAFDSLYAEGQRRYVETFSAYTRQFLDRMARPDVESIDGIPAAIAIDQKGAIKTSRSTVGTMTGINDYFKVLFARCAQAVCPDCEREVTPENTDAAVRYLRDGDAGAAPFLVLAPVPLGGFESVDIIAASLRGQGYIRFLRDGAPVKVDQLEASDLESEILEVVVDRLSARASEARMADSIDQAFRLGRGTLRLLASDGTSRSFHEGVRCSGCGLEFPRPTPGLFSFNTPYGACATCKGFGRTIELDLNRVIPDPSLSLRQGAVKPWTTASRKKFQRACLSFCEDEGIDVDAPFKDLPSAAQRKIVDGTRGFRGVRGFFDRLEQKKYKMHVRVLLARYRGYFTCRDCNGQRLRKEAFYFRVRNHTLGDFWRMSVAELREFFHVFGALSSSKSLDRATQLIIDEIRSRLEYLDSVGLAYLTLDRQSRTLSGGEVERVNLTTALGTSLVGTLFVLDEPSIGLHARDNARLLEILHAIRDRGNTVIVVEHDPAILRAADHVIDLGPAAGTEGGEVVARGTVDEICASSTSLTGDYLMGRRRMPDLAVDRAEEIDPDRVIRIRDARAHNLKNIDVDIPLDRLVALTGVSGSGKSTLLEDVLYRESARRRGKAVEGDVEVGAIDGLELVDEVVIVDQSSIGRTSRGNPVTYVKVYNGIRDRFAATADAKRAGFSPGTFSFNVDDGRCPECAGAGAIDVEMQFLSDVSLPCESCNGKRFQEDVLRVRYRDLNIHETLELTIRDALEHFAGDPDIVEPLSFLDGLGLGYLRLGQPLNTLSGGESQRLKLAGRVLAAKRQRLLFLLDEPTTGLHLHDVARLLDVMAGLVARGHSVVVIEHHLDVIRASDWIIDLGPEGGDGGGEVVAVGTPAEVQKDGRSITGQWLVRDASEQASPVRPSRKRRGTRTRERSDESNGQRVIRVVGARENNLRNIQVDLPRDQFVVVTGMSGSGKSSLLYDIVYAEGQRRYLDCLSPYARQFVEDLHRPDIDHLEGIPPTVAIEQRTTIGGRKSTVGTVTEVFHFLRLLYTRIGAQHCPECEVAVVPRSLDEIRTRVSALAESGGRLLAPAVRGKKGFHTTLFNKAARLGIESARIDGAWNAIPRDGEIRLDRHRAHDVDLVVAEFSPGSEAEKMVRDAVDLGLEFGGGVVRFIAGDGEETVLSRHRACPACDQSFPEPDPRNFSFNSRHGACEECDGYGMVVELDSERLITDWKLPLNGKQKNGRTKTPFPYLDEYGFPRNARKKLLAELDNAGIDTGKSASELDARDRKLLLSGKRGGFVGLADYIEELTERMHEDDWEYLVHDFGVDTVCTSCGGSRIRSVWAAVKIGNLGIAELAALTIHDMARYLEGLEFVGTRAELVGRPIVTEILSRLSFLEQLGLGYLGVDRRVETLSGGEAQRVRLASQLGSNLRGVCYILDEPTIGLHPSDNQKLLDSLKDLRDRGNSVLVIEHDDATISAADHVVDMGPGPGTRGGEVVASGTLDQLMTNDASVTGGYFRERQTSGIYVSEGTPSGPWLSVKGAKLHNLRNIDAKFPLGALTVVAGVSGAGKSTLVRDILERGVRDRLRGARRSFAGCRTIENWKNVVSVREVDQRPIGRSPRSTPATYVGVWDAVRRIFSSTPDAKVRGYERSRFSFNVKGGRCERCLGQGLIKMEMNFLPDVRVDCDRCRGSRFEPETLKVTYHGRNIGEILDMEVAEAREFFRSYRDIFRSLEMLDDLGLGYLTLGQASTTLSGGEAQRVKLAVELAKSQEKGAVLYILDEPTTGLHMVDVERLIEVLRRLAQRGHAVVVIEHHLEMIAGADWVVELGPGGGDAGGELIYQGAPVGLMGRECGTPTGVCLREMVGESLVR